ncbi:AMP-binding protein [Zobellella sp. DQSA1]|uniref:AMP-binding protein n=1 Tax=Zobellella sp. DQSA1 TaxID=3342386 RepID=UPI0035C0E273
MPVLNKPSNLAEQLLYQNGLDEALPIYEFNGHTISRYQLKEDVSRKALRLSTHFSPGDKVLICLNDSPSLVSLFLACIAIGAIPAVINPRCRDITLENIISTGNAKALFALPTREFGARITANIKIFTDENADHVNFSDFGLNCDSLDGLAPSEFHQQSEDCCAYLQYTSGSTGIPKAVMHSTRSTLSFCQAVALDYLDAKPTKRSYSVPRMFFGYGMGNSIFFPLYAGLHAYLHTSWPTPELAAHTVESFDPSYFFAVPSIYRHLQLHAHCLSRVEIAVSAGAPLPEPEYAFWRKQGLHLRDGLGTTEMGHIFMAQPHSLNDYSCAGEPLAGFHCKIVDSSGRIVIHSDEEGDLFVQGPSMALGYMGQPEETRSRFMNGWYRTGDRVCRDKNGYFHFRGRADDLFKVKGRWVTPQAIETRLLSRFSSVSEAALVASSPSNDLHPPTLFLVGDHISEALLTEIKQWLKQEFESPMVPRSVLVVDSLPRNDNGKVERKAIAQLAHEELHNYLQGEAV